MPIEYVAMMVPFAGISIAYFSIWTKHRRKMMDKKAAISSALADQNAVTIREMQARIQVLETIVTDSGFDLAQKIEDLRAASNGSPARTQRQSTPLNL